MYFSQISLDLPDFFFFFLILFLPVRQVEDLPSIWEGRRLNYGFTCFPNRTLNTIDKNKENIFY